MDLSLLCPIDFKVSAGATEVCEEVARFAVSSYVGDLSQNMSLEGMFQSVEANAVKVCFCFVGLFM